MHNKTIASGTVKAYTDGSHGRGPHVIFECTFHHQNSPADTFLQHFSHKNVATDGQPSGLSFHIKAF
eukprot:407892-Ditylum_brightwellii.AAC.1